MQKSHFFLAAALCSSLASPAHAGILDDIKDFPKKAGRELERFANDVKDETNRFVNDVKEEARRAEEKVKKIEREIRRVRDDIYAVIDDFPIIGEQIREAIEEIEELAVSSAEEVAESAKLIEQADEILTGRIDEVDISVVSVGNVLGEKLAEHINAQKIDEFLDLELAGDLKVIHVLMPIQAIQEELDPTGMAECLRKDTTVQLFGGHKFLAGAPELKALEEDFSFTVEEAAKKVAVGCLRKTVMRSDAEQDELSAEKLTAEAKAKRDAAEAVRDEKLADLANNEALKAKEEEYLAEVQGEYEKRVNELEQLAAFKEEVDALKTQMEEKNDEFRAYLASLDPKVKEIVEKEG